MIITLTGANFADSNIGTLDTWTITRSLGKGATYSGPVSVDKDAVLSATVTLTSNYKIGAAGVSVTMGGEAVEAYTISEDGLTVTIDIAQVTGNVVIKVPTININAGEEPDNDDNTSEDGGTTYTITYICKGTSGTTLKTTTETGVAAGTSRTFTTSGAPAISGYTCTSVSPTSATINQNTTVTYTYASSAAVVNLWTITDTDALFENGIYRNTSGVDAGASNFNNTYPSSDKIYINGNTGTFSLNLEGGKTYRWQMVPYYEYGSVKLASPWSNSDGTSPGNFHGKRFWFYDAEDNMIANDKTTSPDGVYLMTVPSDAVYMRFMGWGYFSTNGNVPKKYPTNLMVTEGETEHTEYIAPNV